MEDKEKLKEIDLLKAKYKKIKLKYKIQSEKMHQEIFYRKWVDVSKGEELLK